jgi:hypothetical protein
MPFSKILERQMVAIGERRNALAVLKEQGLTFNDCIEVFDGDDFMQRVQQQEMVHSQLQARIQLLEAVLLSHTVKIEELTAFKSGCCSEM